MGRTQPAWSERLDIMLFILFLHQIVFVSITMASSKKVIPYYINLLWKNTHESQALQKEYNEFEMHLPHTHPTGHGRLANNLFLPLVKSSGFTYFFEGWLDRFGYFETHGINLNCETIKCSP